MRLFTDHCLSYRTITSIHDHTVLQDYLNALTNRQMYGRWNLMSLNVRSSKFQHALNITILTV